MTRIGINLWNWCNVLDESCLPLIEHVANLGFSAVELPMSVPTLKNVDALGSEAKHFNLEVTMCACMSKGRDISSEDPTVTQNTLNYLKQCLKTGETLGAKVLAGPIYAGSGKRHWITGTEKRQEWARAVENLSLLAECANKSGILLAIEPINRYRTSVVNTTRQALQMVHEISMPGVGILFDTYQSNIEDEDICEALEQVLEEELLFHFHACANHRGAPGSGHIPWSNLFELLKKYGYSGHLTMETFCPGGLDSGFICLAESQDALALSGLNYLRKH